VKTWLTVLTAVVAVLAAEVYRARWTASLEPDTLDRLTRVDYTQHYERGRTR